MDESAARHVNRINSSTAAEVWRMFAMSPCAMRTESPSIFRNAEKANLALPSHFSSFSVFSLAAFTIGSRTPAS